MITILLADDQMLTREGLRTILDLEDDMDVIGVARNGEEAVELTRRLHPQLVLIDVQMPVMDGITALKHIKQHAPHTLVLILTTFLDVDYIVEGMASGASGYLLKDMETDKMIAAIRDTVSGQFILPAPVAHKLAQRITQMSAETSTNTVRDIQLTEREQELAELIIKGHSNREIATQLHIAEGTVRNYISNLYSKLDVYDRVQAVIHLQAVLRANASRDGSR